MSSRHREQVVSALGDDRIDIGDLHAIVRIALQGVERIGHV